MMTSNESAEFTEREFFLISNLSKNCKERRDRWRGGDRRENIPARGGGRERERGMKIERNGYSAEEGSQNEGRCFRATSSS